MAYLEHLLILAGIYSILAISLNVVIGFTGILNLGHAAFYGIGAYTSALLMLAGFPFWLSLLAGALLAAFFGFLIGMPCLRLRGDYLAIATLGFGEIIRAVLKNWIAVTRGPLGIPGIPKPFFFTLINTQAKYLILVACVVLLTIVIISRIVHSPFGRVLRAIREDEVAAQALGKNIATCKLLALIVAAFFAGIAGSLYAHYISFLDPSGFTFIESVLMVSMVVLGGMGNVLGSVLGAVILVFLPEPLRFLHLPSSMVAALRQMLYSLLLILLMLYRPSGLWGERSLWSMETLMKKVKKRQED